MHFPMFAQQIQQQLVAAGITGLDIRVGVLLASQFLNIVIAAVYVNLVLALGEEIGWCRWQLPRLLPPDPWPAILISELGGIPR